MRRKVHTTRRCRRVPGRRHMPASGGSTSADSISVKGTAGKKRGKALSAHLRKRMHGATSSACVGGPVAVCRRRAADSEDEGTSFVFVRDSLPRLTALRVHAWDAAAAGGLVAPAAAGGRHMVSAAEHSSSSVWL